MPTDPRLAALETLRARFCARDEYLDSAGYAVAPPDIYAMASALQADGTWADVDYTNDNLKDWTTAAHLSRLRAMAQAWQGQGPMLQAILRGLDGWYAHNPVNPNWWWNQIGAPLLLGETLLCLKGACDASYISRAIPAFTCHEPITRFTGQNLVWTALVQIYHGILTDDPDRVSLAFNLIGKEVRILPGEEGIQPDMSFYQHGNLLYSGGYGQGFAADVGRLMALSAGTTYAFPAVLVDRFAAFILDGSRWMVRGRTFEPGAIGREITRQGHSATRFHTGLRYLAGFEHARQAEAAASAAIDPAGGQSLVTGNRHFWCSDLMVQHRPAYYLSVRVPSPRVVNADWACCGGEGRLCHHSADGVTHIMRDGGEYRDIYPVWNWRQQPGTTVIQHAGDLDPDALRLSGERPFAGGASDGQVGCSAVDFSRGELKAKTAWFLFDEGFVALGAGITATADAPVRTTINQCHWRRPAYLNDGEAPLEAGTYPLAPGTSFRQDGVFYHIFEGTGTLRLGPQSGAWSDCGVGSDEVQTLNVLNAGLDHGVRSESATYAYAVLPGEDASPTPFVIMHNNEALQAVWHAGQRRGHTVFYTPGGLTFPDGQAIAVDCPCILLYHPQADGRIILTLAQPDGRDELLTLHLDGPVNVAIGIRVPRREYAGASTTVIIHPPSG